MLKKVKIFLASSIEDLKLDRTEIGDFFRQLNEIYIDRGVYFSLVKCEDYDNAMSADGKQSQYDEEIRDSELVFFLFFRKVGEYTKHEFEIAMENFRSTQKPKIVTYFKYVDSDSNVNDEVKAFMNVLDSQMKHYYNTYGSIDTLKLGMIMQIKLMNLDNSVVDIQVGKICVNGNAVADSEDIPMFDGNKELCRLKEKLEALTKEYYTLREKFTENPNDMEIYTKYSRTATEKADTEEAIREAEKQMLSLAEKMTADMSSGNLSEKQREGYRLLEKGDYDGALEVRVLDGPPVSGLRNGLDKPFLRFLFCQKLILDATWTLFEILSIIS